MRRNGRVVQALVDAINELDHNVAASLRNLLTLNDYRRAEIARLERTVKDLGRRLERLEEN